MSYPSANQFGLIVAYLIPGFVCLIGIASIVPLVGEWLRPVQNGVFGVGPTVYTLLAALTSSQILNCFRWAILDHVHHWLGLRPQPTDFKQLKGRVEGLDYLVQNHYRYYQFAGNMLLAVIWAYGVNRLLKTNPAFGVGTDLAVVLLVLVLFAASRDALAKYYHRSHSLLGGLAEKAGNTMYNGIGHHDSGGSEKKPTPQVKSESKAEKPPKTADPKSAPDRPSKPE